MPFLVEPKHLRTAARACMRRTSAPGADDVTWADYRKDLTSNLDNLAARLGDGSWRPGPIRTVDITSYTGKTFTAVIPSTEDRIVHRAMRAALDPVFDARILAEWVSGYRPGRNRITALRHAHAHREAGRVWVADIDVAAASGGGTSVQFTTWLATHVNDGSFLRLFATALDGLPSPLVPGSGLWPILFHLRLSQVDKLLDGVAVVRFADNYAAFAPTRIAAEAAFDTITRCLSSVGLAPNARKSGIRTPKQANGEDLFLIDG